MEMHHKLRRDPAWHRDACNICGQVRVYNRRGGLARGLNDLFFIRVSIVQMGHQAAQCTSGTVNWRQIYGDKAFILRPPVYWSEELARKKLKQVDATDLERRAKDFAKVRTSCHGRAQICFLPALFQPNGPPSTATMLPPTC